MKRIFFAGLLLISIRVCGGGYSMEFSGKRTKLFHNKRVVDFAGCAEAQMRRYPEMEARDMAKLAWQAACGAAHGVVDKERAWKSFSAEFEAAEPEDMPLFEVISPDYCRVNLRAWKKAGLPAKWLFNMFCASAETLPESGKIFDDYIRQFRVLAGKKGAELDEFMKTYRGGAIHHSAHYRKTYKPSYRLVSIRFITAFPVLLKAAELPLKPVRVIAIDGRAASGKTTLSRQLAVILDAGVIHMDDFFLPQHLRTPERFAQAGGNVHYERFKEEVLPYVSGREGFSYRRFDCSRMAIGDKCRIAASPWRIVEGAYSLHPEFGNYADLKIFFDITPAEQIKRIRRRNGEKMAEIFAARWIPLEENYIKNTAPDKKADVVIGRE